jgi:LysR family cyn operon transcriptional activator
MNPDIELRHLRYFLAVAETENFTRAAERLGVTQPNVSQQIKDLERELGTPLFRRLGQRLQLTDAGTAFATHAAVVLRKLDHACESVARVDGLQSGHLEVGVVPSVHMAWVPAALARMSVDFPGITIAVHERASHLVETEVEAGRYDIGIGMLSHASPNLRFERLLVEGIALIVPASHALAKRSSIDVKELADTRLVLMPESFDLRHAIDDVLRRSRVRPRVVCEINTIDSTLATVLSAGLPTLLPPIVLQGRKPLGLRAVTVVGKGKGIEFGLFWARGADPSAAAREFAGFLRDAARRT